MIISEILGIILILIAIAIFEFIITQSRNTSISTKRHGKEPKKDCGVE